MGGGDLNMKKSWHPLLLKNQERVWLEEKKALEEKKKLDQLRKELEEERQLQELQRLQEEQTGKKRSERLEWMYATPASGSGTNQNDLEDYLLGKKRVDKILTGDENAKIGASHKNFIAVQNANTARDTAAKVREDPLFAIKQQEQASYQALLSNPLRLKELQERNGIDTSKLDKKRQKKEKREKKEEMKRLKAGATEHRRSPRRDRGRSYSRSNSPSHRRPERSPSPKHSRRYGRSRSRSPRRRHSAADRLPNGRDRYYGASPSPLRCSPTPRRDSDEGKKRKREDSVSRSRSPLPERDRRSFKEPYRSRSSEFERPTQGRDRVMSYDARRRSPVAKPSPSDYGQRQANHSLEADRAARLKAMSSSANELTLERRQRLESMLAQEKEEKEKEDKERMRNAKHGGLGGFLDSERRRVYAGGMEGGLAERIRRGRSTMIGVE